MSVVASPSICSLCDGMPLNVFWPDFEFDFGGGVGEALAATGLLPEKILLPNAIYIANNATKPSTMAATILFLSLAVFPANIFILINLYCSRVIEKFGRRKYAAISRCRLTTSPFVLPFCWGGTGW